MPPLSFPFRTPEVILLKKAILIIALLLCLLAGAACAASFSDDPVAINEAAKSVMKLEIYDGNRDLLGTGSGFVAFDNRHLITNQHVVRDAEQIVAYSDSGEKYILMGVTIEDERRDIAILEFYSPTNLEPLELNETGSAMRASKVVAIGSPKGFSNTIATGIISGKYSDGGVSMLQITAPISPGSSGGALFDDTGRVIGVTTSSYVEGQNLNFAVNITEAIDLYKAWNGSEQTLADSGDSTGGMEFGEMLSVFEEYPKVFLIDKDPEDDITFIETTTEARDRSFAHSFESDTYYSTIYPDIIVLHSSDPDRRFPVLRVWIRYRGRARLNFTSAEFLADGRSYLLSDVSSPDRRTVRDDGTFTEDLLVQFGRDNLPLLSVLMKKAVSYARDKYGDDGNPDAPKPEARLILHGARNLKVDLPESFWTDLGLFGITMPDDLSVSFVADNDGSPCEVSEQ